MLISTRFVVLVLLLVFNGVILLLFVFMIGNYDMLLRSLAVVLLRSVSQMLVLLSSVLLILCMRFSLVFPSAVPGFAMVGWVTRLTLLVPFGIHMFRF